MTMSDKVKVYSTNIEREMVVLHNFDKAFEEVRRLSRRATTISLDNVVDLVKRSIEMALFQCEVDVGLCIDANGKVMEFYGDKTYKRKVYKGESAGFKALEKRETVVEVDSHNNVVIFVPILGPTVGHGVIEIHGLIPNGIVKKEQLQRKTDVIKAMLANSDYNFLKKTRFWKKASVSQYAGVPQKDSFIIVSGVLGEIVYAKNGIPFYGGPRFIINWEDAKDCKEMQGSDLIIAFKETLQSLGGGTIFSPDISEILKDFATEIGNLIESRKAEMFISELRRKLTSQQFNIVGMVELALQSMSSVLQGVKEIGLIGFIEQENDIKSLVSYALEVKNKYGNQYATNTIDYTQEIISKGTYEVLYSRLDNYSSMWLGKELNVPRDFQWGKASICDRYMVILHKSKQYSMEISPFDSQCFVGIINAIEDSIRNLWNIEQARRNYREFVKKVEGKLFEWRHCSIPEICHNLVQELNEIVKADIYVGLLEGGAKSIHFMSASLSSRMEGNRLKRGVGLSFDVIDSVKSVVLESRDLDKKKLLVLGAIVDVLYGKKRFSGKIVKIHGHEKYDVRYDVDGKVEAGVDMARISPVNKAFRVKMFGKATMPFISVPIRNQNKCIGVLNLDSFTGLVEKGKIDSDLQIFLEQTGRILGNTIDGKFKRLSMDILYVVARNQHAELSDIIKAIFESIFLSTCYVGGVVIGEVKGDPKANPPKPMKVLASKGEVSEEVMKKVSTFDRNKFGRKGMQKIGKSSLWLFSSIPSNHANKPPKLFIVAISFTAPIPDPDKEFFDSYQKTLSSLMYSILSHKAAGEFRFEALQNIKTICRDKEILTLSRHEFFNQLYEKILTCFPTASLYSGFLGKKASEIRFVVANAKSVMTGKSIKRKANNKVVSFMAIDQDKPICVAASSTTSHYLVHFGPKDNFDYPLIIIPLVAGIDSVIGVLSADTCGNNQKGETEDQLADVITFFRAIANNIGAIMNRYRAEDFRKSLHKLANERTSVSEAMFDIVELIGQYVPFAQRIKSLTYHPRQSILLSDDLSLDQDLIVLVCPTNLALLDHQRVADKNKLRFLWKGQVLWESKENEEFKELRPFSFQLSSQTIIKTIQLTIQLLALKDYHEKELAKITIPFHSLVHSSSHVQEFFFYANSMNKPFIGSSRLCYTVLPLDVISGIRLMKIHVALSFAPGFDKSNCQLYGLLVWNDNSLGRTSSQSLDSNNRVKWDNMNCFLPVSIDNNLGSLSYDLWLEKVKGKPQFIGSLKLSLDTLKTVLRKKTAWCELELAEEVVHAVSSASILYDGDVIYPPDLNSNEMLSILHLPHNTSSPSNSSSSALIAMKKQVSIKEDEIVVETVQCEVCIVATRDLFDDSDERLQKENIFISVSLDGEDIGTTSFIRGTNHPSWEDEYFKISLPKSKELEYSLLVLEVFSTDDTSSTQSLLGRLELKGEKLARLFFNKYVRHMWFDLENCLPTVRTHNKGQMNRFLSSQIQLSGRPLVIGPKDIESASELPFLEFSVPFLEYALENKKTRCFVQFVFNDSINHVWEYDHIKEANTATRTFVYFRYPRNKSLFQSKLCLNVFKSFPEKDKENFPPEVTYSLSGSILSNLFGQKGIVTQEFYPGNDSNSLGNSYRVTMRGGPENSPDLFDYDDYKLWLDIVACAGLEKVGPKINSETRPNPYCIVKWNGNNVGKTIVINGASTLIWNKERFVLKVPVLLDKDEDRLAKCNLKIEVHSNDSASSSNTLIGYVELAGKDLSLLFNSEKPLSQWFNLVNPADARKRQQSTYLDPESNISSRIKLRGCLQDATKPTQELTDDFVFQVHEAKDLSNVDAFGGANAFAIVTWGKELLGYTRAVKETLNPVFKDEIFLFHQSSTQVAPKLALEVWSLSEPGKPKKFLGNIEFDSEYFQILLQSSNRGGPQWYLLSTNSEFTAEENSLVKGSVLLSLHKNPYASCLHGPTMSYKACLWIHSCSNLPNVDPFDYAPTCYCKVYKYFSKEGEEFIQVYRSEKRTVIPNGVFDQEYVYIDAPSLETDWKQTFKLKIEIYSKRDELIGSRLIGGDDLSKLLTRRKREEIVQTIEYTVDICHHIAGSPPDRAATTTTTTTSTTAAKQGISPSRASLFLAGGDKETFLEIEPSLPKPRSKVTDKNEGSSATAASSTTKIFLNIADFKLSSNLRGKSACVVKYNKKTIGKFFVEWKGKSPKFIGNTTMDFDANSLEECLKDSTGIEILLYSLTPSDDLMDIYATCSITEDNRSTLSSQSWVGEFPIAHKSKDSMALVGVIVRFSENNASFSDYNRSITTSSTSQPQQSNEKSNNKNTSFEVSLLSIQNPFCLSDCRKGTEIISSIMWGDKRQLVGTSDSYNLASDSLEFDCEKFSFDDGGENISQSKLIVHIANKKDALLGVVEVTGSDLESLINAGSHGLMFSLMDPASAQGNNSGFPPSSAAVGADARGTASTKSKTTKKATIHIVTRVLPSIEKSLIHNLKLECPQFLSELSLTVTCCKDLAKADVVGLSDPYAIIYYGNHEIGRTSVINDSCSPVWPDKQTFQFRFPKSLTPEGFDLRKLGVFGWDDMTVYIEVFDWNRFGKNVFLGSAEMKGSSISDMLLSSSITYHRLWLPLEFSKRLKRAEQKFANGSIQVTLSKLSKKDKDDKLIEISIFGAKGLRVKNPDVYVCTRWNGVIIGNSSIAKGSSSPKWDGEKCSGDIHSLGALKTCSISVEVWQSILNGENILLGTADITGKELEGLIEESKNGPTWINLGSTEFLPESLQKKVGGEIQLTCLVSEGVQYDPNTMSKFMVSIIRAQSLAKVDGSAINTNPYVICKWKGKEIGKSKVISNSLNPTWKDAKFPLIIEKNFSFNRSTILSLELWNHRKGRKAEFLGSVMLHGGRLEQLCQSKIGEIQRVHLADGLSPEIKTRKFIQGDLIFSIDMSEDADLSILERELQLHFLTTCQPNAGRPMIRFNLLSVECIPYMDHSKHIDNKSIIPSAKVIWNNETIETYASTPTNQHYIAQWSAKDTIIAIPAVKDLNKLELIIQIWNKTIDEAGAGIGCIKLSLNDLLLYFCGYHVLTLEKLDENQTLKVWKAKSKISLQVIFPVWQPNRTLTATLFKRRINILRASNLPFVNGTPPNTKCIVYLNGNILMKSSIVPGTCEPVYQRLVEEISVDVTKSMDIWVEVVFVDPRNRKEVILGREELLFEYIIRPPKESFDLFLGPAGKQSKGYSFSLSGSVRVSVTGSNRYDESFQPFSNSPRAPKVSYLVEENNIEKTERKVPSVTSDPSLVAAEAEFAQLSQLSTVQLTDEEKLQLGTVSSMLVPLEIPSKPEWIVMPISDMGFDIGTKTTNFIGTHPGNLLSFGIQRSSERIAISDASLLNEVAFDIGQCVVNLRRKDLFRRLRKTAMEVLVKLVDELIRSNQVSLSEMTKQIKSIVQQCFPGCNLHMLFSMPDYNGLRYEVYNRDSNSSASSSGAGAGIVIQHIVSTEYGSDVSYLGKAFLRSKVIKSFEDLGNQLHLSLVPFTKNAFPRFNTMLSCEDVSIGAFQLSNFEQYLGGSQNEITSDALEITKWLQSLGELCGDVAYRGYELQATSNIIAYLQRWDSSLMGLVKVFIEEISAVLQGCKLLEAISVDLSKLSLTSWYEALPSKTNLLGKKVLLSQIKVSVHTIKDAAAHDEEKSTEHHHNHQRDDAAAEDNDDSNTNIRASSAKIESLPPTVLLFQNRNNVMNEAEEVENIHANQSDSLEIKFESNQKSNREKSAKSAKRIIDYSSMLPRLVLSIKYDGMEQLQALRYSADGDCFLADKDVAVYVKNERHISFSVYEVDDKLQPVHENAGLFNASKPHHGHVHVSMKAITPYNSLAYRASCEIKGGGSEINDDNYLTNTGVKGFKITIKKAKGLKPVKLNNPPSPFCELYNGKKLIGSTPVIKSSDSPEWHVTYYVPYASKGQKSSDLNIYIDMYDMTFLSKGNFLGRVELSLDTLLGENNLQEFPLQMKKDVNPKKQTHVRGSLTVEFSIDRSHPEEVIEQNSMVTASIEEEALRRLQRLKSPHLNLTIESALDITVANRFGGASDPYVVVYLDKLDTPVAKTKVISDTINPTWNETFSIPILSHSESEPRLGDFPSLRLELFDYNKLTAPAFLGLCILEPRMYGTAGNKHTFTLEGKANQSKNLHVKGSLSLRWSLEDKWVPKDNSAEQAFVLNPFGGLSSFGKVTVTILSAKDVTRQKRIIGHWNPFALVKFGDQSIGQTKSKPNTVSPEFKESFDILCKSSDFSSLPEIVIEIWHKDFYMNDECLGEIAIGSLEYLHPSLGTLQIPLQPPKGTRTTAAAAAANAGTGSVSISLSFTPIKQEIEISQFNRREYSLYEELFVRALKIPSQPLLMVYDPLQERARQTMEQSHFPTILEKSTHQQEKYVNHPFERTGIISELHYGQICAAARRAEKTILKTAKADMLCLPLFHRKSYQSAPAQQQQQQQQQVTSGGKTQREPHREQQREEHSLLPNYVVCRYPSSFISRRDLKFLENLQQKIIPEIHLFEQRNDRLKKLEELIENLTVLGQSQGSPGQVLVQSLLDFEVSMGCAVKIYLLNDNGQLFLPISVEDGLISSKLAPEAHIQILAGLCRHGLALQSYRGLNSLIRLDWNEFNQLNLPSLDSLREKLNAVEGSNFVDHVGHIMGEIYPDGALVFPIVAQGEMVVGLVTIKGIDKFPHALYDTETTEESIEEKQKEDGSNSSNSSEKKAVLSLELMEHGFVNRVLQANRALAQSLTSSRVNNMLRSLRSFPIKPDTSPHLIIRYAFRMIVKTWPGIREISLWMLSAAGAGGEYGQAQGQGQGQGKGSDATAGPDTASKQKPTLLSRLFTFHSNAKPAPTSESNKSDAGALLRPRPAFGSAAAASIACGVFGAEDPKYLLRTAQERDAASSSSSSSAAASRGRQSVVAVQRGNAALESSAAAEWTISVPRAFAPRELAPLTLRKRVESRCSTTATVSPADAASAISVSSAEYLTAFKEELDRSLSSSPRGEEVTAGAAPAVTRADLIRLVHSEALRCVEILKQQTFLVSSGHGLSRLGREEDSLAVLSQSIFARSPPGGLSGLKSDSTAEGEAETLSDKNLPPGKAPLPGGMPSPSPLQRLQSTVPAGGQAPALSRAASMAVVPRPPKSSHSAADNTSSSANKKAYYFLSVGGHGLGGDTGWGQPGEQVLKSLESAVVLLEANLVKWHRARVGKKSAVDAAIVPDISADGPQDNNDSTAA